MPLKWRLLDLCHLTLIGSHFFFIAVVRSYDKHEGTTDGLRSTIHSKLDFLKLPID